MMMVIAPSDDGDDRAKTLQNIRSERGTVEVGIGIVSVRLNDPFSLKHHTHKCFLWTLAEQLSSEIRRGKKRK